MKNLRASFLKSILPLAALGAFIALAPAAGCVPPVVIGGGSAPCNTDADCSAGEVCNPNGVCAPDGNNGQGETCNGLDDDGDGVIDNQTDPAVPLCPNGGSCVMGQCQNMPPPGCGNGVACPAGEVCVNGVCEAPPPCGPNGSCPPGQVCDASGMCVPDPSCVASPEICDGIDNDCDGVVDNQSDPTVALCQNGLQCINGMCGGPPPPCMSDADCPMGLACVNGVCTQNGCIASPEVCDGVDNDCDGAIDNAVPGATLCPNGGICINGMCGGQPPLCMTNADCPNGGVCVNGMCSNAPPLCMSNADCPAGQICTPNGVCSPGGCVPTPEKCDGIDNNCDGAVDNQTDPSVPLCQNGVQCVNGMCGGLPPLCMTNADCPMGLVCMNGLCSNAPPLCMTDSDCPAGQVCTPNGVCSPGACVPAPEICDGIDNNCDGTIDEKTPGALLCAQGKVCLNGMCTIKQCNSNMDCPAGTACLNGLCQ